MPIYDLFEQLERKKATQQDLAISHLDLNRSRHSQRERMSDPVAEDPDIQNRLFAAIAARLFFFILLLADILWGAWSFVFFCSALLANCLFGFRFVPLKRFFSRCYLNLKRAALCSVALLVSLFSPALGTMIACSYFLMYDKKGVDEVVPSVLRDQFREFFPSN